MFSNRKPITMSVEEKTSGCCSFLQHYFHFVISSKFPTYFWFSTYILICLLGNVVTGMIWLKHHQYFVDNQQKNNASSNPDNETLFPLSWNDATKTLEDFDDLPKGGDILGNLEFPKHESTGNHQVSSYW